MITIHHILPVRRASYPLMHHLIEEGHLRHAPGLRLQHDRPAGQLYRLTRPPQLSALSPSRLCLGTHTLLVELHRLPVAETQALQAASPDYQDCPNVQTLSSLLWAPQTTGEQALRMLEAAVCAPQIRPPRTSPEPYFRACWHTGQAEFMLMGGEWFAVLYFELTCRPVPPHWERLELALDLGGQPAVQVVAPTGPVLQVVSSELAYARALRPQLTPPARLLLDRLQFGAQQGLLSLLTSFLVERASVVYAEDLTYRQMSRDFVRRARRSGLLDFHESWLHNRLRAAGIGLEKVDPSGTSQRCAACAGHPRGQRIGALFTCAHCGQTSDAHINAALNILRLGRLKAARWQAAGGVDGGW